MAAKEHQVPYRAFAHSRHKDSDAPNVEQDEIQVLVRVMQQMPFEEAVRWIDEPNSALSGGVSPAAAIRAGRTQDVMGVIDGAPVT
jgi:hypothetical protein